MTKTYRPLPRIDDIQPGETAHVFGIRALNFLLETDCTATLSDQGLETAIAASTDAIRNPDMIDTARERLHQTRLQAYTALTDRAKTRHTAEQAEAVTPAPTPSKPGGGQPAKLRRPTPIKPLPAAAAFQ